MEAAHPFPLFMRKTGFDFGQIIPGGLFAYLDIVRILQQGKVGHVIDLFKVGNPLLFQPAPREKMVPFQGLFLGHEGRIQEIGNAFPGKQDRWLQEILGGVVGKQGWVAGGRRFQFIGQGDGPEVVGEEVP